VLELCPRLISRLIVSPMHPETTLKWLYKSATGRSEGISNDEPLIGMPLIGVPLIGVPLIVVPLIGVSLIAVPLIGVPLIGVYSMGVNSIARFSWGCLS
jgi:hypothetical protein